MSIDYYAYAKNIADFSAKECEEYLLTLGLNIEIYPDFDIQTHTGFLPFKVNGGFLSESVLGKEFKSGFEIYLNPYTYSPPPAESKGLFSGLFKKKTVQAPSPFDIAMKDVTHCVSMNCSAQDPVEILLAYAFAAYLCKYCNALFDDPQIGAFFDEETLLIIEVNAAMDEIKELFQNGQLPTQEFVAW